MGTNGGDFELECLMYETKEPVGLQGMFRDQERQFRFENENIPGENERSRFPGSPIFYALALAF